LLKGVLDLAVLAVLSSEDGYGYDVVRRLREAGLRDVAEASVYGTLRRLFADGFLSSYVVPSEEGPHRKYYALTAAGRKRLAADADQWKSVTAAMEALGLGRLALARARSAGFAHTHMDAACC
jgi:PadR family transcriptional regulator PadR